MPRSCRVPHCHFGTSQRPDRSSSILVLALALGLGITRPGWAQAPAAKLTSFAADLTPAFDYLAGRGITGQEGLRAVYGQVEAMFRPMPSEVAAQLIPFGFDNVHVPFELRGEPVPAAARRPGWQLGARYIRLGESEYEKFSTAAVVVHELAHAEFFHFKYRSRSARVKRHKELLYELREVLQASGVSKLEWPLYQASELASYYIEASVREVAERIETIFLLNRYRVHEIDSEAARRALIGPGGREVLQIPRDDPRITRIYEHPAWKVGGGRGSAYYKGAPIDVAIPEQLKLRLYRDVLGLRLPETGEDLVAVARSLDSAWARDLRRRIREARDARVRELQRGSKSSPGAAANLPLGGMEDLVIGLSPAPTRNHETVGGEASATREEREVLARVAGGSGPSRPIPSLLRHAGSGGHGGSRLP